MKECVLYKKLKENKVRCLACAHKCIINKEKSGICGVRKNIHGKLLLLVYGKIIAEHIDPIEKKPLYHFLPGTRAYSIGTIGCNLKCIWCQNSEISQAGKMKDARIIGNERSPGEIVKYALKNDCKSIAYTYNEPAISVEFVYDCAKLAKENGLKNVLVTNGYLSKESFDYLNKEKLIDAMNIDLKSFNEKTYQSFCGGNLQPVLDLIKLSFKNKIHIEITTLIIPSINDNKKELEKIARFIASVSKDIPWHISRFFPNYKMLDRKITPLETLEKAKEIGLKVGLKYVYLGNV